MSEEIHVKEHSSPIKTPKQLIIVVFLAFAVLAINMLGDGIRDVTAPTGRG